MNHSELGELIFLVDEKHFTNLRDADFRDRTVLKFDADKVKEVKVTTYVGNTRLSPVFTAKDKTWVLSNAVIEDFAPSNVDSLLKELSPLKAERYVAFNAKGKEGDYNLADNKQLGVKIEVVMDDKKVHTIYVGKQNDDKTGYYARYDQMAGVVFLLPNEPYSQLIGKLDYFTAAK